MKQLIILFALFCFLIIQKTGFSQDENRFSANGKWGYKVSEKVVIEPKYDTIYPFYSGTAIVSLNKKYGVINAAGEEVIPVNFEYCNYNYGMNLFRVEQNGKWGLLNYTGQEVIPIVYDGLGDDTDNKYVSVKINEKWGLIDLKNNTVIPFEYEYKFYGTDGLFPVSKEGLHGFINIKNKTIIDFQYTDAFNFYGGLAEVYLDTLAGFIDKHNTIIIPIRFDYVYEIEELVIVSRGSMYGLWTRTGKELFKPVYLNIYEIYEYGAILEDSSGFYLTDNEGNLLLGEPCSNIEESDLYSEWIYFTRNGKRGIYNVETQELLLDAKYDNFDEYEYDFLIVLNEGKTGIFQISTRTMLVKPLYDEVEPISTELFIVRKDNLYGVIRSDKSFVVKIEYNSVWMESKKLIGAEKDDEQFYFNLEGERVSID